MSAILKNLAMVAILVLVVAGLVKGSLYVRQVWREDYSSDALLRSKRDLQAERQKSAAEIAADLASAKGLLAIEAAKLSTMRAGFSLSVFRDFVIEQHVDIQNALWTSDPLFNDPKSDKPTLKIKTDSAAASHVDQLRQEINQLIASWHNDSGSLKAADLALINDYIEELSAIVSSLTPDGSGLTQAQIDQYQTIVSDLQEAVDEAANTNTGGGNGGVTTPEAIQQQQNVVDQAQGDVDDLQDILDEQGGGTGTGGSGTGGDTGNGSGSGSGSSGGSGEQPSQASPPPTPQPGAPTLIQGTNSF